MPVGSGRIHRAGAAHSAADHQSAAVSRLRFLAAERRARGAEPCGLLGAAAGAVLSQSVRRADRVHHRAAAGLLARGNRIGGAARRATGCTHTTSAAGGDRRGRHGGRSGADRVSRCDACHSSTRRRDGLAGIWCRVVPGGVFRHRHSVHSTCGSWRCRQPGDDDAHGRCGHRRDCIDADVSDLARDSAGKRRGRIPAFLAGFDGTFRVAAALPALVVLLGLARGRGRTPR